MTEPLSEEELDAIDTSQRNVIAALEGEERGRHQALYDCARTITRLIAEVRAGRAERADWETLEEAGKREQLLFTIGLECGYEWDVCNGGEDYRRDVKATRAEVLAEAAAWCREQAKKDPTP